MGHAVTSQTKDGKSVVQRGCLGSWIKNEVNPCEARLAGLLDHIYKWSGILNFNRNQHQSPTTCSHSDGHQTNCCVQ